MPLGCGQCLPCRINRRRQWMWRQTLESYTHEENSFVTLTYSDKYLPAGSNLEPDVLRLTINRFRTAIAPVKVRFFAVGEYGGQSLRPHYHLSLFGVSGDTVLHSYGRARRADDIMYDCWKMCDKKNGFRMEEFNELTAQYVAGYVIKKLSDNTDLRLEGRVPEFARMSRRPGIGRPAVALIADVLINSGHGRALIDDIGDVPSELRIGRRSIPLGRYMLSAVRKAVGFTEEEISEIKARGSYENSVEMRDLLQSALDAQELGSPKAIYLRKVKQEILNVESRASIKGKKRGSL